MRELWSDTVLLQEYSHTRKEGERRGLRDEGKVEEEER